MTRSDRRGLSLSTSSDRAAELYRQGVDLMLAAWPGAAGRLDAAIAEDPDFALAHAARARLHAVLAEPAEARARVALASDLVARLGDERERSHVSVLAAAVSGRSVPALEGVLAHADRWPRDVLILSLPLGAFGLLAFSGMRDHDRARVDLCERHAAHFDPDDVWFLTNAGWAYAEAGQVARGRRLLERAFELQPGNANTVHALVHAMFEAGAGADADALIGSWLPTYDRAGILHGHIAWHRALLLLERGDAEGAMSIYADHVQPSVSAAMPINAISDAASLLWRARLYGHEPPAGAWRPVAELGARAFPHPGFPFVDVHMGLIEAATGDRAAVARRVSALTRLVEAGALRAGPVVPAICRAALAFADDDYGSCADILEPLRPEVARLGGSGAQREVIEDMLIVAHMRSGQGVKAGALLQRRLHRRPSPRDALWLDQQGGTPP